MNLERLQQFFVQIRFAFTKKSCYKLLEFVLIIKPREKGEPPSANIYTDLQPPQARSSLVNRISNICQIGRCSPVYLFNLFFVPNLLVLVFCEKTVFPCLQKLFLELKLEFCGQNSSSANNQFCIPALFVLQHLSEVFFDSFFLIRSF